MKARSKELNAVYIFSGIGLVMYLCAYPFYLRTRYFTMTFAKMLFFYCLTLAFSIGCLILRQCVKKTVPVKLVRKNKTELFLGIFIVLAFVSLLGSIDSYSSFSGNQGRYMGFCTFLMIWFAYIFISRFGQLTKTVSMIFGASVIIMSGIAFLQFIGFDPFGLYVGTKESVRKTFMALLGNKDVYYSYLALAVPFSLYLSFEAEKLTEKLFWHVVIFFGFLSIVACNCDGAYICVAVSALFFFFTRCRNREGALVFLRNVVISFAAALLIALAKSNMEKYQLTQDAIMQYFVTPAICGGGLAVSAVFYVLAMKLPLPEKFFKVLKLVGLCVCIVSFVGVLGIFIYYTFIDKTTNNSLSAFFRFDGGSWGSGRGYIWKRMAIIFGDFSLGRKLFGAGEETISALMNQNFPQELAYMQLNFDSAHNDFLQYLVTHGLFGLIAYLLFFGSIIKSGFKEGGVLQRAATIAVVCFLAQSTVNITQVLTTPLLFVFAALTQTRELTLPPAAPAAGKAAKKNKAGSSAA